LIEAQLSAQEYRDLGLREGDRVVLTPRRARFFVQPSQEQDATARAANF
jgi:sulfate transport system ATP-binding protein